MFYNLTKTITENVFFFLRFKLILWDFEEMIFNGKDDIFISLHDYYFFFNSQNEHSECNRRKKYECMNEFELWKSIGKVFMLVKYGHPGQQVISPDERRFPNLPVNLSLNNKYKLFIKWCDLHLNWITTWPKLKKKITVIVISLHDNASRSIIFNNQFAESIIQCE